MAQALAFDFAGAPSFAQRTPLTASANRKFRTREASPRRKRSKALGIKCSAGAFSPAAVPPKPTMPRGSPRPCIYSFRGGVECVTRPHLSSAFLLYAVIPPALTQEGSEAASRPTRDLLLRFLAFLRALRSSARQIPTRPVLRGCKCSAASFYPEERRAARQNPAPRSPCAKPVSMDAKGCATRRPPYEDLFLRMRFHSRSLKLRLVAPQSQRISSRRPLAGRTYT